MRKIYLALLLIIGSFSGFSQLTTGDIAFIWFNADGDKDFGFVALADIPASSIIYFTDNEPDGSGGVTSGEGILEWNSGESMISAGSLVIFTDPDADVETNPSFSISYGSIINRTGGFNLSSSGDALFAYVVSESITTFLAGVANGSGQEGNFTNSNLTLGSTYVEFNTTASPDGGYYSGPRDTKATFAEYLAEIGSSANWTQSTSDGESLIPNLPTTDFSLTLLQTLGFSTETSSQDETNTSFDVDIPVTLANYGGAQVDLSVTVTGGTYESGDYILNTSALTFTESTMLNISISIEPDADDAPETIEITIAETSSTSAAISTSVHTLTINDDDVAALVITEIYHDPSGNEGDEEFIEIYNAGGTTVDLADYATEGITYTFGSGVEILSGEYIIIASNPVTYTGNGFDVYDYSGSLTNTGETIMLKNASGAVVDIVAFTDNINSTNNTGKTLSLADPSLDNSTMTNWVASVANGGTPGAANDASVWTGNTDDELITPGNWSNGAPSATLSLLIPTTASVIPKVNDNLEAGALRIGSGKSLIIENGSLKVAGDIINDGFIEVFSGASLLPMGDIDGSGSATIFRNTTFTTSEGRYSIVGSPVEDATTDALGDIVYTYDESTAYGGDGSARFTKVTSTVTMDGGDAYFSAKTGTMTFTGKPNAGEIIQTLVYDETADLTAADAGFNLVSNPYTAAIDVDLLVSGNATDISASIYLWKDVNAAGTQGTNADYEVYSSALDESTRNIAGGKTFDGFLRSTQGFFVKAIPGATAINFTPTMMSTSNNDDAGFYRTVNKESDLTRISISNGTLYSDILIALRSDASEGVDRLYDAYEIEGDGLNLYSMIGEDKFAIQGLPALRPEINIALGFDYAASGLLTLKLEEGRFEGYNIYLVDTQLETKTDLSEVESYSFSADETNNSHRFNLLLKTSTVLGVDDAITNDFTLALRESILTVRTHKAFDVANIRVFSMDGTSLLEVKNVSLAEKMWSAEFTRKGLFIMSIETKDGLLIKKFLN